MEHHLLCPGCIYTQELVWKIPGWCVCFVSTCRQTHTHKHTHTPTYTDRQTDGWTHIHNHLPTHTQTHKPHLLTTSDNPTCIMTIIMSLQRSDCVWEALKATVYHTLSPLCIWSKLKMSAHCDQDSPNSRVVLTAGWP